MVSFKKCALFALVGSVLLTAALAASDQQDQLSAAANGAANEAQGFSQDSANLARNTASGLYGLGSKILNTVGRGAASIYSHLPSLPFIGKYRKAVDQNAADQQKQVQTPVKQKNEPQPQQAQVVNEQAPQTEQASQAQQADQTVQASQAQQADQTVPASQPQQADQTVQALQAGQAQEQQQQ